MNVYKSIGICFQNLIYPYDSMIHVAYVISQKFVLLEHKIEREITEMLTSVCTAVVLQHYNGRKKVLLVSVDV